MPNDETRKILDLLDGLSNAVARGFERVDARFERLETRVDAGFDRIERRLGNLETRAEDLEKR